MVTTPIGAGRSQAYDVLVRAGRQASSSAGSRAWTLADPGSFALARYLPDGRLDTELRLAAAASLMRVGEGFDAISDLRGRLGRPRRRDRAGPGRRARPLRARALHRARRARPELRLRRLGDRARPPRRTPTPRAARCCPTGGSSRSAGRASPRRVENLRFSGAVVGYSGGTRRAVAAPDRRVLLVRQRRRRAPGRPRRPVGRRGDRAQRPPGHGARAHERGGRASTRAWDGDGTALVRAREGSVATDVVLEPNGRAVAAGHSSVGAGHAFMLARFDAAGALDRSFGAPGRGADRLPRRGGSRARPRWRARPTASSSPRASPAPAAAARSARAGPRGSRWPATWAATPPRPARRPASGDPSRRGSPPRRSRSCGCPPRLSARRGGDEGARALPAGHALPRQAQPAAAAHEAQPRCCSARARSRSAAGARDVHREAAAQAPGQAAASCGCGSSSRAATPPARSARSLARSRCAGAERLLSAPRVIDTGR